MCLDRKYFYLKTVSLKASKLGSYPLQSNEKKIKKDPQIKTQ